jgi:UDP-N-acetyl-D-mannosaminuronate dehydrogenase
MIRCASCAGQALRQVGKRLYGAKIAVMGLGHEMSVNYPQGSPMIKIIEELVNIGSD